MEVQFLVQIPGLANDIHSEFNQVLLYRSRPSQGSVTGRKAEYKVSEGLIEVLITFFELRQNGVKN